MEKKEVEHHDPSKRHGHGWLPSVLRAWHQPRRKEVPSHQQSVCKRLKTKPFLLERVQLCMSMVKGYWPMQGTQKRGAPNHINNRHGTRKGGCFFLFKGVPGGLKNPQSQPQSNAMETTNIWNGKLLNTSASSQGR